MAVKKQWYEILAPKMFGEKSVGETLAVDPRQLIGRTIDVSLMNIRQDYSKFYIKLKFQIESIDGAKAYTKFVGHDCMRERIYRMVQRYGRRVDCIQGVKTKDGKTVRVKTVFVLIKRVNTAIKNATRNKTKEIIERIANETNFEDFINMMIKDELQQRVRRECNKVYPIGSIEIRKTELLEENKA